MGPVHDVRLVRPFWIGKREVTFAEYDRFALATWRKLPADQGWGREERPVINVSWEDGGGLRRVALRSDRQALSACRPRPNGSTRRAAGPTRVYWWGEEIKQDGKVWANCDGCGSEWDHEADRAGGLLPGRTHSVSTTRRATSGSGCRTAGTTTTRVHRTMARPGKRKGAATAAGVWCAVAPGTTDRGTSARRTATGATPTTGTTTSVSVSPRTSDPLYFVLLPFWGSRGLAPWSRVRARFSFREVVAEGHSSRPASG